MCSVGLCTRRRICIYLSLSILFRGSYNQEVLRLFSGLPLATRHNFSEAAELQLSLPDLCRAVGASEAIGIARTDVSWQYINTPEYFGILEQSYNVLPNGLLLTRVLTLAFLRP